VTPATHSVLDLDLDVGLCGVCFLGVLDRCVGLYCCPAVEPESGLCFDRHELTYMLSTAE
jgi:hypothetical protein